MNIKIEQVLSEIPHYKIHPEMKPFVGKMYDAFRIVLIGESHYTDMGFDDNDSEEIKKEIEQWYSVPVEEMPRYQDYISWYTTRRVLNNYLTHDRSRSHTMFSNPAKVLKNVVNDTLGITINDCDAFNGFIFCNYYQRPETNRGGSFTVHTEDDKQISGETIYHIINNSEINPRLVIFASKKAFNAYSEWTAKNEKPMENCQYVSHPTCAHWYEDKGEKKLAIELTSLLLENAAEIKSALEERKKSKINAMKTVFRNLAAHLTEKGFRVDEYYNDSCNVYYEGEKPTAYPYIKSKVDQNGVTLYFCIGVEWRLFCGIYDKNEKLINKNWQYIPSKEHLVDFLGFTQSGFFIDIDADKSEWIETLTKSVDRYLEKNELKPV